MSMPTPPPRRKCPDCHAVVDPWANFCWLCQRDLRVRDKQAAERPQSPPAAALPEEKPTTQRAPLQFSLAAALIVITVTAIVLGAFVIHPGLGIALVILVTPPLLRTWRSTERARARGTPLTAEAKGRVFATTLGVLITSGIAAAITFSAICVSSTLVGAQAGDRGIVAGVLTGLAIGGVLGLVVFILVWRRFF